MTSDEGSQNKKRLGRGLDALFGVERPDVEQMVEQYDINQSARSEGEFDATAEEGATGGVVMMPIEFLQPGRYQPRTQFSEAALEELAQSIEKHGVLQPLLIRPVDIENDQFEIIAGERRWRAAQRANVHDVPVIIEELSDSDTLEIGLIENLQREDLTSIEEAVAFQRLMDEFSYTQEQLAEVIGKSRSHVANTVRLLNLPSKIQEMVNDGSLSAGHARCLLTVKEPVKLAKIVINDNLSVRDLEQKISQSKEPSGKNPKGKQAKESSTQKQSGGRKSSDILALEKSFQDTLGLKVSIENDGNSGRIIIEYTDLDQFDDVLQRLTS